MRTSRIPNALTALLCGAALLTFSCGRDREEPRTADLETPAVEETAPVQPEVTPPTAVELPEERSVEAREQVAASEREVLEATQRELDRREAELEARARHLRELERREAAARPVPQPAPRETEEVAPAPEPEPEMAEPAPESEPEPEPELPAEEPRPEPATLEAGTVFGVEFLERLSSESSRPGEIFRARVTSDLRQDGRVVIPAGSEVVGEVTEAVPLRKVGGRAKLAVRFTDLVLPSGASVPIEASFVGQGKSETGRDAATIGGAAAGGAVLGRVLNKGDRSKGAVIGAILGAVIGTAVASRTPGEEVTIDDGAVVDLKLDQAVEIRPRR